MRRKRTYSGARSEVSYAREADAADGTILPYFVHTLQMLDPRCCNGDNRGRRRLKHMIKLVFPSRSIWACQCRS